jgi:hypothetical protein
MITIMIFKYGSVVSLRNSMALLAKVLNIDTFLDIMTESK